MDKERLIEPDHEEHYTPEKDDIDSFTEKYVSPEIESPSEFKEDLISHTARDVYNFTRKYNLKRMIKEEKLQELVIDNISYSLYQLHNDSITNNADMIKIHKVLSNKKGAQDWRGTINDPRLGVISANDRCKNDHCQMIGEHCEGHLGYINLAIPVINRHFIKILVQILNVICGNCGRLKLKRKQIEELGILDSNMPPEKRLEVLESKSKNVKDCSGEKVLRKGDITCVEGRPSPIYSSNKQQQTMSTIIKKERKQEGPKGKLIEGEGVGVSVSEIFDLLDQIKDDVAHDIFGFRTEEGDHPRNMIMRYLLVPPPISRTNDIVFGNIRKDEFGSKLNTIVKENNALNVIVSNIESKIKVAPSAMEVQSKELIKRINELILESGNTGYMKSYSSALQSKKGRIRSHLNSFRVNYSGRTVASHNPRLKYNQIGVPGIMAKVLTTRIKVTTENARSLTKLLRDGRVNHIEPGENSIYRREYGNMKKVGVSLKKYYNLTTGDVVHRWLQNGDHVIINRQPSLHQYSLLGMEVVIIEDEMTLQVSVHATSPFNLDFDGDELNIHVVQTEEAREDVRTIMSAKECLIGRHDNRLNFKLTYIAPLVIADMTRDIEIPKLGETWKEGYFPDEFHVMEIFGNIGPEPRKELDERKFMSLVKLDSNILKTYLKRLKKYYPHLRNTKKLILSADPNRSNVDEIVKSIDEDNSVFDALLWYARSNQLTGKMLFSLVLPPGFKYTDEEVVIKEGIHIRGALSKRHIGASHGNIADRIVKNYGPDMYDQFINNMAFMLDIWNRRLGFSIGYSDCFPKKKENMDKIKNSLVRAEVEMYELKRKKTGNKAKDESIEKEMKKKLINLQNTVLSITEDEPTSDPFITSIKTGAKGSTINLSRIKTGGTTYFLDGNMFKPSLIGPGGAKRSNFYQFFDSHSLTDFGVNYNSLAEGLTLEEMINNAKVSRRGTLKGALGTSVGGDIFRKLRLYLQGIRSFPDGTVRDIKGNIIQFSFGYDGLDPKHKSILKEVNIHKGFYVFPKTLEADVNSEYGAKN